MTTQPGSPAFPLQWTYDVFLSFRGEDTRKNFTDHLYTDLKQKGIVTFRDEDELERGKPINPGSKIPEWFDHYGVGSSLSVELPPFWSDNKFMGFAFCAVFALHEHHQVDILDKHQFKTFNATHHLVCCMTLNGFEVKQVYGKRPAFCFSEQFCQVKSDHLWTFYVSRDKYFAAQWWDSCSSRLEFEFKTRGPGLRVKECGVHLVYEGVQELNQTTTQSRKRVSPSVNLLIDIDKADKKKRRVENPAEAKASETRFRTCRLQEL